VDTEQTLDQAEVTGEAEPGGEPSTAEPQEQGIPDSVPYARFSEKVAEYNEAKEQLERLGGWSPLIDRLQAGGATPEAALAAIDAQIAQAQQAAPAVEETDTWIDPAVAKEIQALKQSQMELRAQVAERELTDEFKQALPQYPELQGMSEKAKGTILRNFLERTAVYGTTRAKDVLEEEAGKIREAIGGYVKVKQKDAAGAISEPSGGAAVASNVGPKKGQDPWEFAVEAMEETARAHGL
jgi:hypothetical protein